ncbi:MULTISPECIES: AtpZ/AtpI family protein [Arcicella]|uniref:AtpZ/AtpI family protein n=1 Tax=Arcicella aquatica TaxID=217141 RepID=A0ABU5QVU7_9BACT|nr:MULTISPECIES: AtpZ/AtpI family protein [Arcicella]MDR6563419.1 putative Ca2+/H+ antiporter (TMEM165/GDT1 family) [Arcicella sp. BE51]MDR6813160.1 putative Ca2+/H+ antiporter (TMEM165/GDT1 family) [Arcicella sp. BE140]MDR6824474.1 putative Ca2+/H+ antiporter (TMEM165/GDT1 family) [Arcicella sp. BE139]MEA5260975.1 AtpZ/AtpI family protein [Arcicella aquatica]
MKDDSQNNNNKYMRYMGAGMQMLVTIATGVFLGRWLDEKMMMKTPWFTIGCSLFFIFGGMYLFIKGLPKE